MAYADKRAGQRLEIDGRPVRLVATPVSAERWSTGGATGWDEATYRAVRARAGRLEADVCRAAGVAPDEVRRLALDRPRPARRPALGARRTRRPMTTVAARLLLGRRRAVGGARGRPVRGGARPPRAGRRWSAGTLRGNRNAATGLLGRAPRAGRHAGHVRRRDAGRRRRTPGALVVKDEDRDAFLARDRRWSRRATRWSSSTRASRARRRRSPKRLADAVAAAGGTVRQFESPQGRRARRLDRGRGARARARRSARAPRRRSPSGSAASSSEGDAERRHQTRIASMELDKLALYRGDGADRGPTTSGRSSPRRSRARSGRSPTPSASGASSAALELARPAPRDDAGAGPARRPPPAGPRAARDAATGSPPASGCRPSARRWGSPASTGWRSCATRRGCGRRPS